jgi:fused signal recognition particle receptor
MTDPKHDSSNRPPAPDAPERKKSGLFEVLNRPIRFPFRKDRAPETSAEPDEPKPERFAKLRDRLRRTRHGLVSGLAGLFAGRKLDDEALEELESRLLLADVGVDVTNHLVKRLTERVSRQQLRCAGAASSAARRAAGHSFCPVSNRGNPANPGPTSF